MLLFTFCLLSIAFASNVIELTDSTFEHDTQASSGATTGSWLIDFYAPWCGHCKKLEKNYEKVSDELQGQVNVAKVDVPANKKTGERFGIKGFPTILMIDQGKVYTFQGERSVKGLLAFAKGGYKQSKSTDVPVQVSMHGQWIAELEQMMERSQKLLVSNKPEALFLIIAGMIFGGFLISILACCCKSSSPKHIKRE